MPRFNIARLRLYNQLLAAPRFDRPADVVRWFGAIQAQDYGAALWAIGQRARCASVDEVEQALFDKDIVRTWPMRGTLHFIPAEDARWMLELLTPRVVAGTASRYKQLELDDATFALSRRLVTRALKGSVALERAQLYRALELGGVSTIGQRGIHILGRLAQEGLVCFGPRRGKQHTFVLLDEWVPHSRRLERDDALTELAKRYFTSHGPATVQDFAWWSSLPAKDAREGVKMAQSALVKAVYGEREYWLGTNSLPVRKTTKSAFLLPYYDEYVVAYRDRSAVLDPQYVKLANAGGGLLNPTIVIDGHVLGTWKRTLESDRVVIRPSWFGSPPPSASGVLAAAAKRYGEFLGLRAVLE